MPFVNASHPVHGGYTVTQSDNVNDGEPYLSKGWHRLRSNFQAAYLLRKVRSMNVILTHVIGEPTREKSMIPTKEFTFKIISKASEATND